MKMRARYNLITLLISLATAAITYSCTDHDWKGVTPDSDRITYSLQTANTDWQTRSGNIEGCDIITLLDKDSQDTLYLHPNITDMPAPDRADLPQKDSRGEPIQTPTDFTRIHGGSFGITAFTTSGGQVYINNAEITLQGSSWAESAPRFWPVEALDFYGIAPYNGLTTDGNNLAIDKTNKLVTFDYTVPHSADGTTDAEAQRDIMLAFAGEQTKTTPTVDTKFWHILAGIQFEVGDVAGGKVNSITIRNVYGTGSATFDGKKIGTASDEDPTNSSQDNNTIPVTWTPSGSADQSYTQTFNVDVDDQYPGQTNPGAYPGNQGITSQAGLQTTFMLMPQELTADTEIVISMTTLNDGDKTLTAKLGAGNIWKAGKIYKYVISTESINWTYVLRVEPVLKDASGERRPNFIDDNKNGIADEGEYVHEDYEYSNDGHDGKGIYEYGVCIKGDCTLVGWHEKDFQYKVISYRYRTNAPTVTEPLPWAITDKTKEIPNDITYRVASISAETWMPEMAAQTGSGSVEGEVFTTSLAPITLVTSHDVITNCKLYNTKYVGSSSDPRNLAIYDVQGNRHESNEIVIDAEGTLKTDRNTGEGHAITGTTAPTSQPIFYSANCYVVTGPGYYRIPLVIGSSLNGTQTGAGRDKNTHIYAVGSTKKETTGNSRNLNGSNYTDWPHTDALLRFFGYNGTSSNSYVDAIDNSWFKAIYSNSKINNATFKLIWSDGYKLVTNVEKVSTDYLKFEVPKKYIQQGNAIIGMFDTDGRCIWSYHIWVTEENLIDDGITSGNYKYAAAPIGHCHPKDEFWTGRSGAITFTQYRDESHTTPTSTHDFKVHQLTAKYTTTNHNAVYFQHGRKDPFPGVQILGENVNLLQKHIFYNNGANVTREPNITVEPKSGYQDSNIHDKIVVDRNGRLRLSQVINRPNKIMVQGGNEGTIRGWHRKNSSEDGIFRNLWNNQLLKSGAHQSGNTDKTIYDPSPACFVIPSRGQLSALPTTAYSLGRIRCNSPSKTFEYVDMGSTLYWSSSYSYTEDIKRQAFTMTGTKLYSESDLLPVWPIIDVRNRNNIVSTFKEKSSETETEGHRIWGRWDPYVSQFYHTTRTTSTNPVSYPYKINN